MIISRTPLRVSFAGGGSDLPTFYRHQEGAVVSTAIDKYIHITVNRKFDHMIRASYSITEIVESVDQLKHELIREALHQTGIDGAIEITSISDIPSQGTGLGSSSAYTVGLLNALYAYQGRYANAELLATQACEIEIERCDKPIGKQDQYIAAYGGLQFIRFQPDGTVLVDPVICLPQTKQKLERNLLMLYTGLTRSADVILEEQSRNTQQGSPQNRTVARLVQLAYELFDAITRNNLDGFGEVLHAGWQLKQELASGISNSYIDAWYECARAHGAIGGKLLGAGGGGFLLLYAPVERHPEICRALPELRPTAFKFAPQGSKIILVG